MDGQKISLRQALNTASFVGCGDICISSMSCDSRSIRPGDLFVAIPGARQNGHSCISAAIASGASAVLVDHAISGLRVAQCVVPDTRVAWGALCMLRHKVSVDRLTVAGITGTNGKSTTAWLLRSILVAGQRQTGMLGTIEYHDGCDALSSGLTTPDADTTARLFRRMLDRGTEHCVMELSSHALDQSRCSAVRLSVAAITNITQDHFDYHGTAEHYRAAKRRIGELLLPGGLLLVGMDDPGVRQMLAERPSGDPIIGFGMDPESSIRGTILHSCTERVTVEIQLQRSRIEITTQLAGRHNLLNILAAAGMAEHLGVDAETITAGLETVASIPGRLERIRCGQPFEVFVDYAHTPDGLQHCLRTLREHTRGRIICVFGAGGDRDRHKRPLMARAVEPLADLIVVTSDNPRTESPAQIIREIMSGFSDNATVFERVDREDGIRQALQLAQPGDTVVIAGRGHETMQQIGSRQICFDDRRVIRRLLAESGRTLRQDLNHHRHPPHETVVSGSGSPPLNIPQSRPVPA